MDRCMAIYEPDELARVARALDSPLRRRILGLVYRRRLNINQIAQELGIPQSTAAVNVQVLEQAALLSTRQEPARKGAQKVCTSLLQEVVLLLQSGSELDADNTLEMEMPLGLFFDYSVAPTCGMASEKGLIGYLDQPDSFLDPHRAGAQIIWFESGYLEYRLPFGRHRVKRTRSVAISAEVCSEFPTHNPDWPSDITLWINDAEVGTWTAPGDMGDRRGYLNPPWWGEGYTQYGFLKEWRVTAEGSFIDGVPVSNTRLEDLRLEEVGTCHVRIGVKEDAEHKGGMNIFGRMFGNYPQDIRMRVELEEPE